DLTLADQLRVPGGDPLRLRHLASGLPRRSGDDPVARTERNPQVNGNPHRQPRAHRHDGENEVQSVRDLLTLAGNGFHCMNPFRETASTTGWPRALMENGTRRAVRNSVQASKSSSLTRSALAELQA